MPDSLFKIVNHPDEIRWQEKDLPDIHTISKNSRLLIWIVDQDNNLVNISIAYAWENELNSLRWSTSSGFPVGSSDTRVKYWAWIVEHV